nr:MoaD/ThiS family protein [uncultured Chryseobacterium sp.]
MEIKIIAFGQISEITGKELTFESSDLFSLRAGLIEKFPELAKRKFIFAVNKKLVQGNITLQQDDVVALMPPYSGG